MPESDEYFLRKTVEIASQSVAAGGGPFGALIVKNNKIISQGNNQVTLNNDPTAHAEIVAIRNACQTLNNFSLQGCIIYSSCEPCPMCMSAIYWSRIDRVVFAASEKEAAQAGFDDAFIAEELSRPYPQRNLKIEQLTFSGHDQCFIEWNNKLDKNEY